jgi:hypothetical protein
MSNEGPKSYPVVYDAQNGLQYLFQTGYITLPEAPLNSITTLTGDVTASGPGAATTTLTTVNNNVGSFTSANITVDAKGRVTAASSGSGAAPGGNSTDIQFNNSGAFAGTDALTWTESGATASLSITGTSPTRGGDLFVNSQLGSRFIDLYCNDTKSQFVWGNGDESVFIGEKVNGGDAFDPSSIVELNSTTRGFLPPAMTTTQRDAITAPAAGLEIYNTTTNTEQYYNGSLWKDIGGASPSVVDSASTVGGAATESVAVAGLLTTSTIWAVTQRTKGGANLPLLSWTNTLDGHLTVIYSADMGVGAVVRVLFIP